MYNDDITEEPVPQHLKVINVCDFIPGVADNAKGEQIGILTVEHCGEIEHPMMLRLRDVKRLVALGTMILAHHGDEEIITGIKEHCPPKSERPQTPADPRRHTRAVQSSGLTIRAWLKGKQPHLVLLDVLFAYWKAVDVDGPLMVGVRCSDFSMPHEFIAKIEGKNTIRIEGHLSVEVLPESNWLGFAQKEPGHAFVMGDRRWVKLSVKEMKKRIGRRQYHVMAYRD